MPLLDILISGHNDELLAFPLQIAFCPKHVVQYNQAIWKMLQELKEEFFSDRICFKVSFVFSPSVSKDFSLADSEGPISISAWCFIVSASEVVVSIYAV